MIFTTRSLVKKRLRGLLDTAGRLELVCGLLHLTALLVVGNAHQVCELLVRRRKLSLCALSPSPRYR
jgi:hypothetical protein